jgi:hypothetical protein
MVPFTSRSSVGMSHPSCSERPSWANTSKARVWRQIPHELLVFTAFRAHLISGVPVLDLFVSYSR